MVLRLHGVLILHSERVGVGCGVAGWSPVLMVCRWYRPLCPPGPASGRSREGEGSDAGATRTDRQMSQTGAWEERGYTSQGGEDTVKSECLYWVFKRLVLEEVLDGGSRVREWRERKGKVGGGGSGMQRMIIRMWLMKRFWFLLI